MPARIRKIRHDDETRAKIQAAAIIRRLHLHVEGKLDLTPTQVSAAKLLLGKVLPDLVAADITADHTVAYVARLPAPVQDLDQWQQQAKPLLQ